MWTITVKGLLAHKLRYALTATAIALGVAFLAGTLVFTDTIKSTFDGLFSDVYRNTDAVVRGRQDVDVAANFASQRQLVDASVVDRVRRVPGVSEVRVGVGGYAQLVGRDGQAIGNPAAGAPTLGEAWTPGVDRLNPYRFVAGGRPPRTGDEIAIDKHSADVGDLAVGDRVLVLTKAAPTRFTITGIVRWGGADSPLGASITLFTLDTAERVLTEPGKVSEIAVAAAPGISQEQMTARLRAAVHDPAVEVVTGRTITQEGQTAIRDALGFFDTFLLVFAVIALFVASFLIFNTFSIVIAQRSRELALLRAVGASRRQVMVVVLGESTVVGALASAVGVLAGLGLAVGLRAMLGAVGMDIPAAGLVVEPRTAVAGLVVGLVVSLLATAAPAWHAGRIAPITALSGLEDTERTHRAPRAVNGGLVAGVGVAVLCVGLFASVAHRLWFVGSGAALVFLGVAVLGPVISRPASAVLGAPLRGLGVAGVLARNNAMRNPKRTAGAGAALLIGVSLVALISVLASSTKTSVSDVIDSAMRADFVVSGPAGNPGSASGFSPQLQRRLAALPEVASATGVRVGPVRVEGASTFALAVDPHHVADVLDADVRQGAFARVTATGVAVSTKYADDHDLHLGERLPVVFPATGRRAFTVQVIYGARAVAGDVVLPLSAAKRNFASKLDYQVYVDLAPGISVAAGRAAMQAVLATYPSVRLLDRTEFKQQQQAQIEQLLNLMYGLLALALVIALVGIANTLALSIHERTRELGLLRAVGMTRRQLRSTVLGESLIITLFGGIGGLLVGTLLGWAVVVALKSEGVTRLAIPAGQLVVIAVLAALAGVLAAAAPSRRAARLDILRAISRE